MKATLIISIYKNTTYLKAVLDSLTIQTVQDFEIIISEDGNDEQVKAFIESYPFRQPMQHLSQPDVGWRKNQALNKAIKAANNPWLIFIDGDCVLHKRFIEMHLRYAEPNVILGGKRVKLDQKCTKRLLENPTQQNWISGALLRKLCLNQGKCKYCDEGFFINPNFLTDFAIFSRKLALLKGCNMSFSKESAILINGFDEDYQRPAIGEDTDLSWRFLGMGLKQVSVRNRAIVYHLDHPESWHSQTENAQMRDTKLNHKQYICLNGLRKI